MQNSQTVVTQTSSFNSNIVFFNAQGVIGQCSPGVITNIDLKLTDDHFLTGGHLRVKGQVYGDFCDVQIVDIDNVVGYGPNVVLRQFVTNWYLSDDDQKQADFDLPYPAKVIAGLYIRLVYHSTTNMMMVPGPKASFNYNLHKVLT